MRRGGSGRGRDRSKKPCPSDRSARHRDADRERGDQGALETEIIGVHFSDGAMVKEGDLLFTLDSRADRAEIKQRRAVIAGAQAQLEQAERDVARYTELVAKNATTQVTLNNAQTQVNIWRATVQGRTGHARKSQGPARATARSARRSPGASAWPT